MAILVTIAQRDKKPSECDFRRIVEHIIDDLSCPPSEVSYMLDHCYYDKNPIGIDMFISRDETVQKVSDAFKNTVYWEEDEASLPPGKKGWYWKKHWIAKEEDIPEDLKPSEPGKIIVKADFLVYGRIMFANHDKFGDFTPATPKMQPHPVTGRMDLEPQPAFEELVLKAGEQVIVKYNHDGNFSWNQRGMPFIADHPFRGVFGLDKNDEIIWDVIGAEVPQEPEMEITSSDEYDESDDDSIRFHRDDPKDLDYEFEEDESEYGDD